MTISPITDFSRFKTAIFMNNQSLEGLKSVSILLEKKKIQARRLVEDAKVTFEKNISYRKEKET